MNGSPYRDQAWHTHELIRQREWWQWQLAALDDECQTPSQAASTRQYVLSELADLNAEIDRRARYRQHPDAPPLPGKHADLRPFWEDVKQRVSVLDFYEAASLGILRKSGDGYRSRCPLCNATNATTFGIFDGNRAWHCFRCGEGGDVFSLASHIWRDLNFVEVAYSLADLFGIERPAERLPNTAASGVRLITVRVGR